MMNDNAIKRQKYKIMISWIALIIIFICELFFYTWCRVQCIRNGYQITAANEKYQELSASQKKLNLESARLKSPERILKYAKYNLGLIQPTPESIVILR